MPTIKQLPAASFVSATDVLPISQSGTTKALSVAALLSSTQPALALVPGKLLGRVSASAGGPEPVALGAGLGMDSGTLAATGADHLALPVSSVLDAADEVVVNSGGGARRMPATLLRGLFTAGAGVTISGGTISAAAGSSYVLPPASLATLGGVKVDGSTVTIDAGGVISTVPSMGVSLPVVLGGSGAPPALTATGATFTLQNGNVSAADVPRSPGGFDGIRSVLVLQPGSSVPQAAALGGYALSRATFGTTGAGRNLAIALWGEGVADVDGARAMGLSVNVNDGAAGGTGAGRVLSSAVQVGVRNALTAATGLAVMAGFSVQPVSADGFVVSTAGSAADASAPRWANGIAVQPGSASCGVRIGAVAGPGARASMPLVLEGVDGSGAAQAARLEAQADGTAALTAAGLTVQGAAGGVIVSFGAGTGQVLPPAAASGASASQALTLTGRTAAGAGASVTVRADAGGSCAVTAVDVLFQLSGAVRVNGAALVTTAAVPGNGGLLATSGVAGAAQPATAAQFEALLTAWLQSKATAPGAAPGWWNNSGIPTFS